LCRLVLPSSDQPVLKMATHKPIMHSMPFTSMYVYIKRTSWLHFSTLPAID